MKHLSDTLSGYANLEFDLETGERGARTGYLDSLFAALNADYKPVWVNNNAAAVLLCLNTIKKLTGFEHMIISRGELVEIGGGFRVPEIMAEAGFKLVEVGTTNKTRLKDYKSALKGRKAVVCRVHPSNFVMQGFVEQTDSEELIELCRKYKAPLIYDAGTMTADELRKLPKGFDCVTLSTDKTLGSIQGGLIAAKPKLAEKILKNPLYRAMRLDKLSLTALEVAFEAHVDRADRRTLPFSEMLHTEKGELEKRAEEFLKLPFQSFALRQISCDASVGGGSWPGETWKSIGLEIVPHQTNHHGKLASLLRQGRPPVVITVTKGSAQINLASVLKNQIPQLKVALHFLDQSLTHRISKR